MLFTVCLGVFCYFVIGSATAAIFVWHKLDDYDQFPSVSDEVIVVCFLWPVVLVVLVLYGMMRGVLWLPGTFVRGTTALLRRLR